MEAKQIIFALVTLAVLAGVVFVLGFQAGVHIDAAEVIDSASVARASTGALGVSNKGVAEGPKFSFFDDLRTPASTETIRRLDAPRGNANNSPELAKKAAKRHQRADRRNAWLKKKAERDADKGKDRVQVSHVRALERKREDQNENVRTIKARDAREDKVRTITEREAARGEKVRTITERGEDKVRTIEERKQDRVRKIEKAAPKAAPMSQDEYTLQLGAFDARDKAAQIAARHKGRVVQASVPGRGTVYRVRFGRFGSLEDAHAAQRRVRSSEGVHAFVMPL